MEIDDFQDVNFKWATSTRKIKMIQHMRIELCWGEFLLHSSHEHTYMCVYVCVLSIHIFIALSKGHRPERNVIAAKLCWKWVGEGEKSQGENQSVIQRWIAKIILLPIYRLTYDENSIPLKSIQTNDWLTILCRHYFHTTFYY